MRAVMLVPWAIPTVVAAQMWKWMYDDIFGVSTTRSCACTLDKPVAWISEAARRCGRRRRRHLEDDALRGAAAAGRSAGDPARSYEAANVDGASSGSSSGGSRCRCYARDPRHADLPHARRTARVRRVLRVLRLPRRHADDGHLRTEHHRLAFGTSATAPRSASGSSSSSASLSSSTRRSCGWRSNEHRAERAPNEPRGPRRPPARERTAYAAAERRVAADPVLRPDRG